MGLLGPDITYRQALPSDANHVIALLSELLRELGPEENAMLVIPKLPEDTASAFENSHVVFFLAEHKQEGPIGLSRGDILHNDPIFRLRSDMRCGYVDQMYVLRNYRKRGIGTHLLKLCENWFSAQGVKHVLLHAAPKALPFYQREGYVSNREMIKRLP